MANPVVDTLLGPQFRGVPFFVRTETSPENGRRIILHDFIHSSQRFAEDLGEIPEQFELDAYVGSVNGVDYRQNALALENALDQPGFGELILPTFGAVNVVALAYSKTANLNEAGIIRYKLKFSTSLPASGPVVADPSTRVVYTRGDAARAATEAAFIESYVEPTDTVGSFAAQELLQTNTNELVNTFSFFVPATQLEDMQAVSNSVNRNLVQTVASASRMATALFAGVTDLPGLWQSISLGLSVNIGGFGELIRLTSYEGNYMQVAEITANRRNRNLAAFAQIRSNQVNALVTAYEVAAAQTYATSDEVNATRTALENAHERIMRIETSDANVVQSNPDLRDAIEETRLAALSVLGGSEQGAFRIDTIEPRIGKSAFLDAYQLYAEEFTSPGPLQDRALSLRDLNRSLPALDLSGEVNIFRG